jgi:hypothetical protein
MVRTSEASVEMRRIVPVADRIVAAIHVAAPYDE